MHILPFVLCLCLLGFVVSDDGKADRSRQGMWSTSLTFPVIPVAGAVIPGIGGLNDRVLVWSAYSSYQFGGAKGYTATALWDLKTGAISTRNVTETKHDMFCPGINADFEGRLIVTGGGNANVVSIYDPAANQWVRKRDMRMARGYQSATTLSDGRTFTIGGSYSGPRGGKNGEVYDPITNTWTLLPGCEVGPMLTTDHEGPWRTDNHAWLFPWTNGSVFQAGPSNAMHWYNTNGKGAIQAAGFRNGEGSPDQMCGPAVMFDAGKIFSVGGAQDYNASPAFSSANIVTIATAYQMPVVEWSGAANYKRTFANTVVLPDGSIFISGGQTYAQCFSDSNPVQVPEIFDPVQKTFSQVARDPSPRTYHSIALLLPDATVLTAGGGMCYDPTNRPCPINGNDHFDGNVYRPPYLYDKKGNDAIRPIISSINNAIGQEALTVGLGSKLTITLKGRVTAPKFALVRVGSATHTTNTDQRRIALKPVPLGKSVFSASIPTDAGVLLPGYYYLFAVVDGVPSIGSAIKVVAR